jgi:hypothetical protein
MAIADLPELEDPAQEAKLWPGNPAYKDQRYEHLKERLPYYSKELKNATAYLIKAKYPL